MKSHHNVVYIRKDNILLKKLIYYVKNIIFTAYMVIKNIKIIYYRNNQHNIQNQH